MRLLECESKISHNKIYNLAGPTPLSFKCFCIRIFDKYKKKPIFIHVPVMFCKCLLLLSNILRVWKLMPDQIDRLTMLKDNVRKLASKDYKFRPREFFIRKI